MARIELTTMIAAPRERCFDLARSIDLHLQSTAATQETAYVRDSMTRGAFRSFDHDHFFTETPDGGTAMRDVMTFLAPLGPLGRLAENLVLVRYLERFLAARNQVLRQAAESGDGLRG